MRQGLVHTFAWSLATGAAVTLSWWGVHTVMAGTAYDPPRAVPIAAGTPAAPSPPPLIAATQRPESPPPARPSPPRPSAHGSTHRAVPHGTSPPPPSRSSPAAVPTDPPSTAVKGYEIDGGRAVFSVGADSAALVSATPNAGWQMQTWTQPEWIRVTFTRDGRESSVFYTWNGHAPVAQFDER